MVQATKFSTNNFLKGMVSDSVLPVKDVAYRVLTNWQLNPDGSIARRYGLQDVPVTNSISLTPLTTGVIYSAAKEWQPSGDAHYILTYTAYYDNLLPDFVGIHTLLKRTATGWDTINDFLGLGGGAQAVDTTADSKHFYVPTQLALRRIDTTGTRTDLPIQVNDFWGVTDNLGYRERPTVITSEHLYNLFNQGWTTSMLLTWRGGVGVNDWPSNSDIYYYSKASHAFAAGMGVGRTMAASAELLVPVNPTTTALDVLKLRDAEYESKHGASPAPRGRYTIDLFNRGNDRGSSFASPALEDFNEFIAAFPAETQIDITDLLGDTDNSSTKAIEIWAGRMFFAPVGTLSPEKTAPTLGNTVFFSTPLLSSANTATNENDSLHVGTILDPTAEDFIQTAADGGSIIIGEMRNPISLKTLGGLLLVVAKEGVWLLNTNASTFNTYNISYIKVLDKGCESADCVVVNGKNAYVLTSTRELYRITEQGEIQPLTLGKVQSKLTSVPTEMFKYIQLTADRYSGKISLWLPTNTSPTNNEMVRYTSALVYEEMFDAFNTKDLSSVDAIGFVTETSLPSHRYDVLVSDSIQKSYRAYDGSVVLYAEDYTATELTPKFAEFTDETFSDLGSGTASYVESTEIFLGQDLSRKKTPVSLNSFFLKTEEVSGDTVTNASLCLASVIWDWGGNLAAPTASSLQEAYKFDNTNLDRNDAPTVSSYNKLVSWSTLKVSGRGHCARVTYLSNGNVDCIILGYQLDALVEEKI